MSSVESVPVSRRAGATAADSYKASPHLETMASFDDAYSGSMDA
ncbi:MULTISPECIES: hypothetical protein [Micrococcaceae]|nr:MULTISPECIES: hypothetical protein [Micrococcaceae]MBP2266830.1 hypothetical protein [Pseudarthrobacter sp. PvP004]